MRDLEGHTLLRTNKLSLSFKKGEFGKIELQY